MAEGLLCLRMRRLDGSLAGRLLSQLMSVDASTPAEPWGRREWLLDLPDKWRLSRVMLDAEKVVAAFIVASRKGSAAHIHRVAVADAYRRRGLGRQLIEHLAAVAAAAGILELTLKVDPGNAAAVRLYEVVGFREADRVQDRILMSRRLSEHER